MNLGAYYYLWYGSPTVAIVGGGDWERSGSTNQPVLGKYNSRDDRVISQHVDWAKEAGIDFFAISWSNIRSWDDQTLKDYYLKHPKSSELRFCIFYDSIPALNRHRFNAFVSYDFDEQFSPGKTKGNKFIEDFEYLAENYFNSPQYLKVKGEPFVVIYNVSAFRNVEKYFDKVKENMAKRGISLHLSAVVVEWSGLKVSSKSLKFLWQNPPKETVKIIYRALRRLSPESYEKDFSLSKYFKSVTAYNLYTSARAPGFLREVDKLYQKFWQYAREQNLSFIPDIMPGYDDRRLMEMDQQILERNNGSFYKEFWEIAKKYLDPELEMALVTTFNEWHEGTEVEPSREYANQYLEITNQLKSLNNKN